jgi:hypothetical protein
VVDLLRPQLAPWDVTVQPVTITPSEALRTVKGGELSCGKTVLVSRLQTLMQTERVKVPANAPFAEELEALRGELQAYEVRYSERGSLEAGAFSTGAHDDLATALGLAVLKRDQFAARVFPSPW